MVDISLRSFSSSIVLLSEAYVLFLLSCLFLWATSFDDGSKAFEDLLQQSSASCSPLCRNSFLTILYRLFAVSFTVLALGFHLLAPPSPHLKTHAVQLWRSYPFLRPVIDSCPRCHADAAMASRMARYLPPALLERLQSAPDTHVFHPTPGFFVIMYIHILEFEHLLVSLSVREQHVLLHNYYRIVAKLVDDYGGTIDKTMSGATLVLWPCDKVDSCDRAVGAALDIHNMLGQLCECPEWRETFQLPSFRCRIALHRGTVMQGTYGGNGRYCFTVIGDVVNTCSRIESHPDTAAASTLVSGMVRASLSDSFLLRNLGALKIRGKPIELDVHEVVSRQIGASRDSKIMAALSEQIEYLKCTGDDADAARMQKLQDRLFPEQGPTGPG